MLRKRLQLLLCSIVMQNIQIFCGVPVMFVVSCVWVVVFKNERGLLDHETRKRVDEMSLFFCMLIQV